MSEEKDIIAKWNAGATVKEIADQLGCTKNKISGMLWRARKRGLKVDARGPSPYLPPTAQYRPARPRAEAAAPRRPDGPVGIMQHTNEMCRMIVSDHPLMYCSDPRVNAYCVKHTVGMYTPTRK